MRIIAPTPNQTLVLGTEMHYLRHGVFLFGFFDGIHLGHLELLKKAVELARGLCVPVVVWTLENLVKKSSVGYITTTEEKFHLLGKYGADYIIAENFDDIRNVDGRDFFGKIVEEYAPSAVICGFNFKFGRGASCTAASLREFADEYGIPAHIIPPTTKNDRVVSSSQIRSAILMGDFTTVSSLLGRPYTVTSPVLHGKKIGRTIGHPTINMRLPADKIKPPLGVYSCIADFTDNDGRYIVKRGVCNLGYRPTVNDDESDITLETYLFDFSDDIYGKTVTVYLIEMLRHEQRFSSLDELMLHIEEDVVAARKSLRKYYNEDSE